MKTILLLILACLVGQVSQASSPRVAILGDSITYGGGWPTRVESALRSTPAFADAEIVNFGLASETVSGLSEPGHAGGKFPRPCLHERLTRILDAFKPTHVLACYGINDGIYMPLDATRQQAFQDGMTRLKTEVEKRGAKLVVITAPLYDGDNPAGTPQGYDGVLDAQAAWLLSQKQWQVIDIRPDLRNAVAAAKRADPQFVYARDRVHPGQQGHDFIAASIIRQLWSLWQLPGKPAVAPDKALELLGKRRWILQHAWLKKTGHTRPGVPDGLPLEEAEPQAAKLLQDYRAALAPADLKQTLRIPSGYIIGADISRLQEQEDSGVKFSDNGVEKDLLQILKDHGFNWIRLRVFNDPTKATPVDKPYSTKGYCDLPHTIAMAKRIKAADMKLLVDFHYSDSWADPGKQFTPAAWSALAFDDLVTKTHDWTQDAVQQLKDAGAMPDTVQIGNEITSGLMTDNGGSVRDWKKLGRLLKAGLSAVKDVDTGILTMLHIDKGGNHKAAVQWLENAFAQGMEFDVFGLSCYARWQGPTEGWKANFEELAKRYPKLKLVMAEVDAQAVAANEIMLGLPDGRGLGTFIWEPAHGGGDPALFDHRGAVIPDRMAAYDKVRKQYGPPGGRVDASVNKKFPLVTDGQSKATIVVNAARKPAGGGMSGTVWFAATEFQNYVKRMSGAELPIIALADNATAELEALQGKPVIAIGEAAFTRRLGISTKGMVEDGFHVRVTPEHLSIVGHDALTWWSEQKAVPIASGTLHGVYHLLRELGVRTFFEDESLDVIPDRKTVALDVAEIKVAPFFPFRCGSGGSWGYKAGYGGNLDPWPTRHSFANEWQKITLDGKETTMDWWARYRESHPEYFAVDTKGNRMSMLRFTEAGVQQQIVSDASAWFKKGENYYSLLQNDGYTDIDQSPETQRLIDHSKGLQGLLSEAVMRPFVEIAAKLNESHPDKTVTLGAYSCYAYPPKDMKALPPNAAVMLALQRLNNIAPQGKAVNRQLLDEWIKLNPKELYLWEYYCFDSWRWRVPHYELFPRFLPHTIAEDIRHLAAVRERHPNFRGQWMFGERRADDANAWWHLPNMYVTGRLFWNPKLDIDVLLEDFHSKAFGDAAGEMRAFYTLCEKTASEGMAGLYVRKPPVITYQGGSLNEAASMGYDYIDGHFTLEDFLTVWNPGVIGELRRMIDGASRKAKETPSEARVEWVRKHFASLEDIVVKNSPAVLPTTTSDWNGHTKHSFDQDPIDLLEPIARAKLPLRHVISPNDLAVPAENNTPEAKRRLEKLGWRMDLLVVDAATTLNEGHHFPLVGIEESVAFIKKHAGTKE